MDTGEGKFEILETKQRNLDAAMRAMEEKYPEHGGWFHVGEILEIKGSRFRVKNVKPTEIRLKLLKRNVDP